MRVFLYCKTTNDLNVQLRFPPEQQAERDLKVIYDGATDGHLCPYLILKVPSVYFLFSDHSSIYTQCKSYTFCLHTMKVEAEAAAETVSHFNQHSSR